MKRESSLARLSPSRWVCQSVSPEVKTEKRSSKWVTRTERGRWMKTRKCSSWPKFLCHNKIKITINDLYVYLYIPIYLRRLQSLYILFHSVINRACLLPLQHIGSVFCLNFYYFYFNSVQLPLLAWHTTWIACFAKLYYTAGWKRESL